VIPGSQPNAGEKYRSGVELPELAGFMVLLKLLLLQLQQAHRVCVLRENQEVS